MTNSVEHIFDYCKDIESAVSRFGDDFNTFKTDKAYHDLVCFYLFQIGELAGQLSPELKAASAEQMNWSQMKGMRNIVAHHYGSIQLDIVWNTLKEDIPNLMVFCSDSLQDM